MNARWKPSMSVCSPSPLRSWLSWDENDCLTARRSLAFLLLWSKRTREALRTGLLDDLLARPLEKEEKPGGLWDRQGNRWVVFDVDGTRQAARVSRLALHA